MVRQIEFDEETDRLLADLAQEYGGDLGKALADLVRSHENLESFLDQCENAQSSLRTQKEQSEQDFREGRVITWDEVKRRNGL